MPASVSSFGSNAGSMVSFVANIEQVAAELAEVDRWVIPYAVASALTDTAKQAMTAERKAMPWYIDRPTPWTVRGLRWEGADKRDLVSRIYFEPWAPKGTAAGKYLRPMIEGGPRRPKRYELHLRARGILAPHEYTVPGVAAPRDSYGNIGAGNIERMLSQLRAAENRAGYLANETARSRRRNRGRVKSRYFVAQGDTALPRGIWERHGRTVRPFLLFVGGAPTYMRRYPFAVAARQAAIAGFPRHFATRFNSFVARGKIRVGMGTAGYMPAPS